MGYHASVTPIIHEDHDLLPLDYVALHVERYLRLMGDILRLLIGIIPPTCTFRVDIISYFVWVRVGGSPLWQAFFQISQEIFPRKLVYR